MAFWGVEIKPGKPFTLLSDESFIRLRITQATLGLGSSNGKGSLVQCNVGKKTPVLLCSLLPDKAESIPLELEFQEAEEVTFSVIGPRSVHLTGFVLGKSRVLAGDDESESFGEDIGAADTDMSDELSDDDYGGSFIDDCEPTSAPPSPSTSEEEYKSKKKADKRKSSRKRLKKAYVELSESEDEAFTLEKHGRNCIQIFESDEDDEKPISSLRENVKMECEAIKSSCGKLDDAAGKATSDPQSDDGQVTRNKLDDVTGQETSDCQADNRKVTTKKQSSEAVEREETTKKLDSVVEEATDACQPGDRKVKRKKVDDAGQETEDCQSNDKKVKRRKKQEDVVPQTADDDEADDKKSKKKKRKNKKNESVEDTEKSSSVGKKEANSAVENDGGLVIEELKAGEQDGKVASSGRKVTVHFTGRLKEGGRVFDSTVGKTPLKLRLGKDAALDGLHLGIDGMRAGGKRKIVIPPELGYGSKGTDGVPPNAWLIMEVELLRVR